MKKLLSFLIALVLCLSFGITALAGDNGEEKIDQSQPRLMVTEYNIDGGSISPSKQKKLSIKLKNFSKTKALSNVLISIADESGELEAVGMPYIYLERVYANSTISWSVELKALSNATIGLHKLTITSEFEDKYQNSFSGSDSISINVRQSVNLSYDGVSLSPRLIQGETETVAVNLMNTGKTDLSNCRVDFSVKGLDSAGTLFIGEIPAGENKEGSANLRVSSELLGDVKGNATISYDDAYGKSHSKRVKLSSVIEKKVEASELEQTEEEESKNSLWWLFLVIGVVAGGGIGCAIPIAINNSKKRKEDDLRL